MINVTIIMIKIIHFCYSTEALRGPQVFVFVTTTTYKKTEMTDEIDKLIPLCGYIQPLKAVQLSEERYKL